MLNATTGTYIENFNSAQHSLENLNINYLNQPMRLIIDGFRSHMPQQRALRIHEKHNP